MLNIDHPPDRITISDVAKKHNVDDRYLNPILNDLNKDGWTIEGRQIIPCKVFARLQQKLCDEMESSIVTVWKFCRQHDLTPTTLVTIVKDAQKKEDFEWQWVDNDKSLCTLHFVDTLTDQIEDMLESLEAYVFLGNFVLRSCTPIADFLSDP